MAQNDGARSEALRARGADEILREDLGHRDPGDPHDVGHRAEHQDQHGEHEVTRLAPARHREPPEAEREQQDEDRRDHEERHGDAKQRDATGQSVDPRPGPEGGDDPERETDRQRARDRQGAEHEARPDGARAELPDRLARVRIRDAEVEATEPAEEADVLLGYWAVEAELARARAIAVASPRSPNRIWTGSPGARRPSAKTRSVVPRTSGAMLARRRAR